MDVTINDHLCFLSVAVIALSLHGEGIPHSALLGLVYFYGLLCGVSDPHECPLTTRLGLQIISIGKLMECNSHFKNNMLNLRVAEREMLFYSRGGQPFQSKGQMRLSGAACGPE